MPTVIQDGRGRRADHAPRAEAAKTSATRAVLWTAKWLNARRGLPSVISITTAAVAASATRARYTAAGRRRVGVTTAVAGTTDFTGAGMPEIAGRSGMSLGIGEVMRSR
ncbi:hypothetical protein SBD_1454 [Streptomyces bottropensis ATCC 25435]|uniref:Uncharacterized protein n=1 Tax=Streptomyces bottropensis ATCC 25435 TaxID=1054862 RepID=M3DKA4_9ACTN|nr:hypothetical protein SBD_1454 [Streptomyces bottropensis ATCC 25435]